jgi:hypothetical protein
MSLDVVGVDHPNRKKQVPRRFEIEMCSPGEPVELIPEPTNPADERAVAVFSARGIQIGYLRAERAPLIGGMIKAGTEIRAIFQAATKWGAIVRITTDGTDPVLPLPSVRDVPPASADDSGFYPDPEWPDD